MKTFKFLLITITIIFVFGGCSQKEIVVNDRVTTVKVPTKVKRPNVKCDFRSETDIGVIGKMTECIAELNKALNSVTVP